MFSKFFFALLLAITAGVIAGHVTDHLKAVERQEQREAFKKQQHEKRIIACANGKTFDIMYAGVWCKK